MGKSLYEVKQKRANRKNKNTITDADYFLREKTKEDITKNTINMTPTIDTSVEDARIAEAEALRLEIEAKVKAEDEAKLRVAIEAEIRAEIEKEAKATAPKAKATAPKATE